MEPDQLFQQYSNSELMQTIGQLYMDISRSQIIIRQLQHMVKDRDNIIAELNSKQTPINIQDGCRTED